MNLREAELAAADGARVPHHTPRRVSARAALAAFLLGLVVITLLSVAIGPTRIPISHVARWLVDPAGNGVAASLPPTEATIVWSLRLPRVLLAAVVGAGLGASGAAAQGLFRNPLADPGLVGVTSGATLGAAFTIVMAGPVLVMLGPTGRAALLPLTAFAAGALTTLLVVRLGGRRGRASTATVLLAGVAINALAGALVGLLSHVASDAELRNITFWTLGGLGAASWTKVVASALPVAISIALLVRSSRGLDVFALGESTARLSGLDVVSLRRRVVVAQALGVGAAVAAAGLVGFVGLVVPHLVRMLVGPRQAGVLPASAALGAGLVVLADTIARTVIAPAELPVGVLTACVGAPFFLVLLRRELGST
ncbi:MAG: iron ABC transporter permease [Polyangiaceae bacterium]